MKKNLKIIIPVIMAIVILAIVGIIALTGNKKIKLTMENYSNYLNVKITSAGIGTPLINRYESKYMGIGTFYPERQLQVKVEGISNNFNYENIVIEVKFDSDYNVFNPNEEMRKEHITETVIVDNCNIAGNGSAYKDFKINGYTLSSSFIKGEVVSVAGTIISNK